MAPRLSLLAAGGMGFSVGPVSSEGAVGLSRTKARGTEGLLALGELVADAPSARAHTPTRAHVHTCVFTSAQGADSPSCD